MKKCLFIILLVLLTASCAQSKLDCRGKDPRCTDETGFDLIDIDFFWYGNVSYRKEKTRFVFITNIGRELVIIFYFLVMSDNICYVYFLKNKKIFQFSVYFFALLCYNICTEKVKLVSFSVFLIQRWGKCHVEALEWLWSPLNLHFCK